MYIFTTALLIIIVVYFQLFMLMTVELENARWALMI